MGVVICMVKKLCGKPGCPVLVEKGTAYCEKHQKQKRQWEDQQRGSTKERGYAGRWPVIRREKLRRNPFCEWPGCREQAREVHHVIKIRDGGTHAFENLRSLCFAHHDEMRRRINRDRVPYDAWEK